MPDIDLRVIAAASVAFAGVLWVLTAKSGLLASVIILLTTLTLYPAQLTSSGPESYAGMTQAQPVVTTYMIAIVVAVMRLVRDGYFRIPRVFIPLFAFLGVGIIALWEWNPYVQAGIVHLAFAALAWAVGLSLKRASARDEHVQLVLIQAVSVVVLIQLGVSMLQIVGVDLFPLAPHIAEIMGSRTHGTLNHPNNLGKVLVLITALLLPFVDDADGRLRRLALTTTVAAGIGVALTQGRANIIAFAALVLVRVLLLRGPGSAGRRVMLLVFGALAVGPFVPEVMSRFEEDPEGGSRSYLTTVALAQLERAPLLGIGPNEYVRVVGQSDAMTANGLPVHNSFLLVAVELGIVGATLLFLPLIATALMCVRKLRSDGGQVRDAAATALALSIAYLFIALTGWGAISTYLLPLWFFVLSYLTPSISLGARRFVAISAGANGAPIVRSNRGFTPSVSSNEKKA